MLTVHGWQATTPGHLGQTQPTVEQRLMASRARARRRWALRSTLVLLLAAITLCLLVIWRRDRADVEEQLSRLQPAVAALQARINDLGLLPYSVPELGGYDYATSEIRSFAQKTSAPVIIAWPRQPTRLILRRDGRAVVIFEARKLRAEWMTASQFQARWFKQNQDIERFERERHARPPELP